MSGNLDWFSRLWRSYTQRKHRRKQRRTSSMERLERRDLLAAAIWHNPVFPLDVTGDEPARVSALDALQVINWLNDPSLPRRLPRQSETSTQGRFVDTTCDGRVSALDALRVINHLNSVGSGVVGGFFTDGGSYSEAACSPQLLEGSGFATELERVLKIPANRPALEVTFQAPEFDSLARQQIRDAFEIQIVQADGTPLSNRISPSRGAAFNWTEGYQPVSAGGMWMDIAAPGQDSKLTFDLSEFPVGTEIRVLARLVNNDSDDNTSVIIRGYEFVELPTSPPTVANPTLAQARAAQANPFDIRQLSDLSGLFDVDYGRTSLSTDKLQLVSQAKLTNLSNSAVLGPVVATFDNFSDPNISMMRPDGILSDGRPYINLTGQINGAALGSGESIDGPEIRFLNDSRQRFQYRLAIYGRVHHGPIGFTSQPVNSIEAGGTYRYQAKAQPSIDSPLNYSVVFGPESMAIDPESGQLNWQTRSEDLGTHQVTIRATDEFGLFVEQRFEIQVVEQLANRPPVFTSEPELDAFVASPFEVHTYATGQGPVAATLLPSRTGAKHVVTANQSDNHLGLLPGGGNLLGQNRPISLGEFPASELRGMFEGPQAIELGIVPNTEGQHERDVQQVLAEDVNGDGNPDAIALVNLRGNGNWNDPNDRGFLVVRYGNGDGSFSDGWQVQLPTVAGRIGRGATVHFADVTADGLRDLVVTTIATNQILVYANTGTGSFDPNPITSAVAGNYVSLTQISDVNRDGHLDLVVFENVQVQIGGRQAISIYRGDGAGRFSESQVIAEDTNNGGNGYIADVDGVNGPDIVRLNYNNLRLETYLNDGTGGFGERIDSATKSFHSTSNPNGTNFNVNSGYFDDFDSDGIVDALLSGPFGVTLMRGQGDGRFGDGTPTGSVTLLPYEVVWYGIANQSGEGLDLNGDEHPDFLFGNVDNKGLLLMGIGRGDGTFELSQYSTSFESDIGFGIVRDSQGTIYASIADFNRDGVVDVLIGNSFRGQQAGSVGLMLGDQPGTFRAPQSLRNFDFGSSFSPMTFGMRESVTGDFNNDGFLDLVTYGGIGFGGGFYFAPGRGDGTFGKYEIVFGGITSSNSLTTLDIDRDGILDLAWIDGGQARQAFGLGNGSFQALPSVTVPGGPGGFQNALQVDDFNGDGYLDLVLRLQTGNIDTNFITRLVVLLYDPANRRYNTLPDANDTITNWPRTGGFYFDESVGIGDLNGDGQQEIFFFSRSIPSSNTPARWVILEPTGGPATDASTLFRKTVIENPSFIPHDRSIYSYVVDDFDGDGINDIAYSGNHVHTTVMFGNGDFTFRDATQYYTHTFQLDSGDFNGDGVTDLVAMWGWGFLSYSVRPYQSVLYGRGDGTFSEMNGFTAVANINLAAIGDFNGDGRDDLAGTPDQTQGVAFASQPQGVSDIASGDLNGDGKEDLVSIIGGLNRVKLNLQVTDELFARQPDLFTDLYPVDVDLLDVDQDGLLDILTANQQGKSVSIFRQSAGGNFTREDIALPVRPSDLRIADLNGDGVRDLLVLSKSEQTIVVLAGSNGSFSLSLAVPLGFTPGDLVLGDVTGDNNLDLALTDPNGNRVMILPGNGDGSFGTALSVLGVVEPGAIALADMNRDGRKDLIVAQPKAGRVGFLYQRGAGRFTTPQWIQVGAHPSSIEADDVNGDGATDVIVVNRDDDTVSMILNRFDPNRLWTYQPTAIDPDGDPVSFELVEAPGGMLMDPATNTIYWAPMPEQIGGNNIVLEASDGRGGLSQQGFQITVTAPISTDAPRFTSTPVTEIASDSVYRYQPNVVLQEEAAVRYSLVQAPEGMTIDTTTGEVEWDPRSSALKLYTGTRNYGFIEAPDSPSLRPASVTVEGWYYFEDPRGAVYENLLAKRASATNQNLVSFGLEYYYGTLRAKVGTPASSNSLAVVTAPAPVEFQKWTHVAMTFDDSTKILTLFINGENVGTAQSPEGISYNSSLLQSGRNIAQLARQRIWSRALTPAELSEGMLADVPRDAAGLVLQWDFLESRDASTIFDSSLSRNHGYLAGTPDWLNYPVRQSGLASQAMHQVIIRVEDGRGGVAEQAFQLDVVPPFQRHVSGIVFSDTDGDGVHDVPADWNRIANGDFSSGLAAWETDFYRRGNQPTTGWLGNTQVTVGSSTAAIPLSPGYSGHTNGSGQDLMLIVNGDSQDRVAWRQNVSLNPGQSYDFSFWAIRPNTYEAARLMVRWNGQPLGSIFTLEDVAAGSWKQFRHSFTPALDRGVLEIVSLGSTLTPNPGLSGTENSFAIDDLMLIPAEARRVLVPGTANPYLSGMPNGATAYGSTAPQGTPPSIDVQPGQVLRIRATGHTRSDGFIATRSPDGIVHNATGTVSNALNGISQYAGPNHGSLLGVFLNEQAPSGQAAPTGLDFRGNGNVSDGINFISISPQLRQLFFIGDGFTNDGIEQKIVVPQGATRLFLANSSTNSWSSNTGAFEVQVFTSSGEPVQAGRTVFLDSNRNSIYDPGEPTAVTDAQGRYVLSNSGKVAHVGLLGVSGQLQSAPETAVVRVGLESVTPSVEFGSRSATAGSTPVFLSQPIASATAPSNYVYQAFAQSSLGISVSYELVSGPEGMTIDRVSGLVQWQPLSSQAGTYDVLIKAFDQEGRFEIQRFPLNVTINTAPIITSTPPEGSQVGVSWSYRVLAQDAEQRDLTYRLASSPAGMTISATSGLIDFTPTAIGSYTFEVEVDDGFGGISRQPGSVNVSPAGNNILPQWIEALKSTAIVQRLYASQLAAVDGDHEPLTYTLVSGPAGLTVSTSGQVQWQPSELGTAIVTIAVEDTRGGRVERTESIAVLSRAPMSELSIQSLPITAARVGSIYAYDVIAPGAVIFELVEGPVGMSIDPQRGTIRWLPTRDSLGVQNVTVRATDLVGNVETQAFSVAVRSSSLVPTISSAPPTEAVVGRTYLYSVLTSNPSESPLQHELDLSPVGMTIDAHSGEIAWTPTAEQLGPAAVVIRVSDGLGNFSTQAFSVVVAAGASNRAPSIFSVAPLDAVVGQSYVYTLQATDPEADNLTYGLRSAPVGFGINSSSGVVTWMPQAADVGTVSIVLTASDPQGAVAVQSFQVDVRAANRAPEFISNPTLSVSQGGLYRYDILAWDLDREPLTYELVEGPEGMTIDALGRVRWQTQLDTPLGGRNVVVRVRDGLGASATQSYSFGVVADTQAPRMTIVVTGEPVLFPWTVHPAIVRVIAADDVGVTGLELQVDGQPVELAPDGTARVYFSAPGNGRLLATATDAAGNRGTATGRVNMRSGEEDGSGNPAPEATITSISEGANVSGFVDVIGTAISPDFESYRLSYRRIDQTEYRLFHESTEQVTAGSLGKWDTTLLENDNYVVKLEVFDTFGSFAAVEVEVSVTGNLKLGNFRLSFEDLTIPVAGIPITVARTYDTLRADRDGDFGYGWSMEYRNTDLRVSLPKSGLEDLGIYTPYRSGTKIFMTLPGGQRVGWTFTPELRVLPGWGQTSSLVVASPRYTPHLGNTATLTAGSGWLTVNEFGELYAAAGMPWNPASPDFGGGFTVTTADGIHYRVDGKTGLMQSATDRNGATITFSEFGITSSEGGMVVSIERDRFNRIQKVTDPEGSTLSYRYSSSGDLIEVTDREGHTTKFSYRLDRLHFLDSYYDPMNREVIRGTYDEEGRLQTVSASGQPLNLDYDTDALVEIVTGPFGQPLERQYDLLGNVIRIKDTTGVEQYFTYDAFGILNTYTDGMGATQRYTMADNGQIGTYTDAAGQKTYFSYDAQNNLAAVVDAIGRTYRFEYDSRGNRISETDAAGGRTTHQRDSAGNLISSIFSDGSSESFEYDSSGRRVTHTDRSGVRTQLSLSPNGHVLSTTIIDPATQASLLVGSWEYDRNGRVVSETNAAGGTRRIERDPLGNELRITEPSGVVIEQTFDAQSNLTQMTLQGGFQVQQTYHSTGLLASSSLNGFNMSSIDYDDAGRPITSTIATMDGSQQHSKEFQYDANGLLRRATLPDGSQLVFQRDLVGNIVEFSSNGNLRRAGFDAVGRVTELLDSQGQSVQIELDALDRPIRKLYTDGTTEQFSYDLRGNTTQYTDRAGRTTTRVYDHSDQLVSLIDPLGLQTTYAYDFRGNLVSRTDADGNVVRLEYNALNQPTQRTDALGNRTSLDWDEAGRLVKRIDSTGTEVQFVYDQSGLLSRRIVDGQQQSFEYDQLGLLSKFSEDGRVHQLTRDAFGRVAERVDHPGEPVSFTYDIQGRLSSYTTSGGTIAYNYDNLGRLQRVVFADGTWVQYTLDANSRITGRLFSNGIRQSHFYDDPGRLLETIIRDSSGVVIDSASYTYSNASQITSILYHNSSRITYRYDAAGQLIEEQYLLSDVIQRTIQHTYDRRGNRVIEQDSVHGVTNFVYDVANRLLSKTKEGITTNYSYDNAGRLVLRRSGSQETSFVWDADARLISSVTDDAGVQTVVHYEYDNEGIRTAKTVNGVRTEYVVGEIGGLPQVLFERTEGTAGISYGYGFGLESVIDDNTATFRLADFRDSTVALYDSSGNRSESFQFTAFGMLEQGPTSHLNSVLFGGHRLDPETGLIYMRARYFDPAAGRFLTMDPAFGSRFLPISQHEYQYGHNDPVNNLDPTGKFAIPVAVVTIGIIGLLLSVGQQLPNIVNRSFDVHWDGYIANLQIELSAGVGAGINASMTFMESSASGGFKGRGVHLLFGLGLTVSVPGPQFSGTLGTMSLKVPKVLGTGITTSWAALSGGFLFGGFNLAVVVNFVGAGYALQGFGRGVQKSAPPFHHDNPLIVSGIGWDQGITFAAGLSVPFYGERVPANQPFSTSKGKEKNFLIFDI